MKSFTQYFWTFSILALVIAASTFLVSCEKEIQTPIPNITSEALQVKKTEAFSSDTKIVEKFISTPVYADFHAPLGELDLKASELVTYIDADGEEVQSIITPIRSQGQEVFRSLFSIYLPKRDSFTSVIMEVDTRSTASPDFGEVRIYTPNGIFLASSIDTENNAQNLRGDMIGAKEADLAVAVVKRGYWKCVAECVREALKDPILGPLCGGICASCVVPPFAGCPPCVACLGGTVAGCMLGCAIWG